MLYSSDIYFGLSAIEGRQLAYQFALKQNKSIPPNWATEEMAGRDWFESFLNRHTKLSMRKPEATSVARATAFNRANVELFYTNYEKVLKNIEFLPHNIWNVDEVGVTTVHKPNRCISRRGRKQVGRITSSERGTLMSMALAVNAAGMKAPPYLIFPRVRFEDSLTDHGPVGCWGGATPSGFMDSVLFYDFIQRFQKFTRCSTENPILLILDNHVSHRTLDVLTFCRANGIHVLSFPPHCSHRLQPLDVSVFSPFKTATNQLCSDWILNHPGRQMRVSDLPPVFARALEIGATERNIKSGFRATGIYPFDRQIFQDIDFLPSKTTDRPYIPSDNRSSTPSDNRSFTPSDNRSFTPSDGRSFTPSDFIDEEDIPIGIDMELSTGDTVMAQSPLGTSTSQSSTRNLDNVLEDILPFPQAPPRLGVQRGRKPQKTAILTGDEAFNEIRVAQEVRDEKKKKTDERKAAAAAKKAAIAAKKEAARIKKLVAQAKKAMEQEQVPKRINKRRQTTATKNYVEQSDSESEE